MNQPTEDRIRKIEERLDKLEQQQTEPIQITVERKYPDRELLQEISRKQDELKEELESISRRQNEYDKGLISHSRNINAFQTEMEGARADILKIRESQGDFRDKLETIATKEDLSKLETRFGADIAELKIAQAEQGKRVDAIDSKLDLILKLLQPRLQ